MPEPLVAESQPFHSVWRPALRVYELPPSRPVRLNKRERRKAIHFWKQAGVIDDRGQVDDRWKTVVGAVFPSSTD